MVTAQYRPVGTNATELAASIESGLRKGALQAGDALPTVRALASELGLAPGTVASAYRALRERGLVHSDGRRGTRVRAVPSVVSRAGAPPDLPPGTVDLSTGLPSAALLPELGPPLRRVARRAGTAASPAEQVLPRLAASGRALLSRDGVPEGSVTVTSGALDAIERVLTSHLRPGDKVAVEDPGWPNLLDLVASLSLRPVPVPVDEAGPRPEGLDAALRAGAQAVVVTSRAQNPTGAAISTERRDELRRVLARAPDTLVIEDDHAADLSDVPLSVVAGTTTTWAFVRSMSKPYGPDLRVALCAGDTTTISRVEGRLRLGAGWVSSLLQELAAELLEDRQVDRTIAAAARTYASRRSGLVAALAERGVSSTAPGGINVWVPVTDETRAVAGLLTAGWLVAPGSRFRIASSPGIRITVGGLSEDDLPRLAEDVAAALATSGRTPTYSA
ncbi:MAG: GntR family transcriptional regulator [Blastococcus sp.]|nr:GntR family transcriptional regulator [Blastococcus sp.]